MSIWRRITQLASVGIIVFTIGGLSRCGGTTIPSSSDDVRKRGITQGVGGKTLRQTGTCGVECGNGCTTKTLSGSIIAFSGISISMPLDGGCSADLGVYAPAMGVPISSLPANAVVASAPADAGEYALGLDAGEYLVVFEDPSGCIYCQDANVQVSGGPLFCNSTIVKPNAIEVHDFYFK